MCIRDSLVRFHLRADTAHQFFHHFIFAVDDLAEIERRARRADSVFVAVYGVVVYFGAVKQGFGRDASFVQADAAQFPLFEQHDVQPFRTGAFRSHVACLLYTSRCV